MPSIALPGLQGDPGDPTGSLPHGGPESLRKELAGSNERSIRAPQDRHEFLAKAKLVEAQAVLIILGQAPRDEDLVGVLLGERLQRRAAIAGANARGWNEYSESRP